MGLLINKVCFVSGGAGSIGLASARRFLDEGAKVDAAAASLAALGTDRVFGQACDVTDSQMVKAAFEALVARWGKIDVIFSNAGDPGHNAWLADYPEEAFERSLAVHARGAFLACKHGAPRMNDGASIIITSSVGAMRGGQGINMAYITAKHAQTGVMRVAARALAPRGIRVNTLNPGPVDNEFQSGIERDMGALLGVDATAQLNQIIPLKRHASAHEIAGSALYLASDLSSFVTGTVQLVDGGLMS